MSKLAEGANAWGLYPPANYSQYLFMQGSGSSISESVFIPAGSYELSYYAAARPYYRQSRMMVYHDDHLIWRGYLNRTWERFNLTTFSITAPQTKISFANEVPIGDGFDFTNFVAGITLKAGMI